MQQECFGWGFEAEAFSRSVVVASDERVEEAVREFVEVGFAREEASQSLDGVFDAALLPRGSDIAEESVDAMLVEAGVLSELGAVVEGGGSAQIWRQWREPSGELIGDICGGFVGLARGEENAGAALMGGQDDLAVGGEEHGFAFPMSGHGTIEGALGALGDGPAILHVQGG